tara:strand:+ start:308 stop:1723 length:1416 start_codon:yes stop_codon:yes gene_type:complete
MAQEENKKSLLDTISNIGALESELLEDVEVESKTEEVVEEATEEVVEETTEAPVEEGTVYKVWVDEEQDAEEDEDDETSEKYHKEEEDEEDEEEASEMSHGDDDEEEDDKETISEPGYMNMDMDDDEESDDEEAADAAEDEADDMEVDADDIEDEESDDEEEMDEMDMDKEVEGDSEEDDGIEGTEEPDDDVNDAISQISKTITAAATHKAMKKIEAAYGSMKEDIDALCAEDDSLTEDFKAKAATIFEAAVQSKVKQEVEEIKESYVDYINEEVSTLNEGLIDKIDSYLTYVAEQWVEKNDVALTNIARTEIAEAFMGSLKETFENHYIEMPEGKTDVFDELSTLNVQLEETVDSKDEEIKKLAEELEVLKKSSIIEGLAEGLAETQKEKFKKLTEDISFESEESYTKKAKIIRESYFASKKEEVEEVEEANPNTIEKVVVEEVNKEEPEIDPVMAKYIKASVKLNKEAF